MNQTASAADRNSRPPRRMRLVGAIQWGVVVYTVATIVAGAVSRYYMYADDGLGFGAEHLQWLGLASLVAPLAGLVGGYWWVGTRGPTTERAHRRRLRFVGALLVLGVVTYVSRIVANGMLGRSYYAAPYFLLPSLLTLLALAGAYVFAYRDRDEWYERRREELVAGFQWALVGMILATLGFFAYGEYLVATRTSFSLDGAPFLVGAALGGFVGGYLWTEFGGRTSAEDHERRVEFITLLVILSVTLQVLLLVLAVVASVPGLGGRLDVFGVYTVIATLVPLLGAAALAYVAETDVYRRLSGR